MIMDNCSAHVSVNRTFAYRRRWEYWSGYLIVGVGIAFVYAVLSYYDLRPLSALPFQLLIAMIALDILMAAVLRIRSPRAFQIRSGELLIEWRDREVTVPLDRVSVRRSLAWLLNFGTIFQADGRTFAVFKDLDGFQEFVSMCSGPGQTHASNSD